MGQWGGFHPIDWTAAGAPVANKKLPEDVVQRIIDAYDKKVRLPPAVPPNNGPPVLDDERKSVSPMRMGVVMMGGVKTH